MQDSAAIEKILNISRHIGIDLNGARVCRSSSRLCLGVEHGDYNGTELFGIGTDRFIWLAFKPNGTKTNRLYSINVADEGVVSFEINHVPPPGSAEIANCWARFPMGVDYILNRAGYKIETGIDAVIFGNIPGGGMSRSASLTLNLILSVIAANGLEETDKFKIIELAQAVENQYIGSPCGQLDQIMILFARAQTGTHYDPRTKTIKYIPLGKSGQEMSVVVMDTGTNRLGLDKSTYKIRTQQCRQLLELIKNGGWEIEFLADVRSQKLYDEIIGKFKQSHPDLCKRLDYIYHAQKRFYKLLDAWKLGDIETVGQVFRADGIALRDDYEISGPELEAMCDIARTVPGVLGERMLGGGDKGASGALVRSNCVGELERALAGKYPKLCPDYADKYALHVCRTVDGIKFIDL